MDCTFTSGSRLICVEKIELICNFRSLFDGTNFGISGFFFVFKRLLTVNQVCLLCLKF